MLLLLFDTQETPRPIDVIPFQAESFPTAQPATGAQPHYDFETRFYLPHGQSCCGNLLGTERELDAPVNLG